MQDVTDIVWRIAWGRKGITESILWTGSLKRFKSQILHLESLVSRHKAALFSRHC